MALSFDTTEPDLMQHATPHGSSPSTTSKIFRWPSMSPDLNPNKHIWNESERCAQGRVNAPANLRELFQALEQERLAISAPVIYNLIQSMAQRCWAVINSWGEDTPYWWACHSVAKYWVIKLFFFFGQEECSNLELWLELIAKWNMVNWIFSWIFILQTTILKRAKYAFLFFNRLLVFTPIWPL